MYLDIIFFVFIYILGIANALIETFLFGFKIPYFVFLSQIFDVYLLCLFVCIFPLKYRNYIVVFVSLISYILCVINIFCVYRFNAKLGPQIYNLVLETNPREAGEFFDNYIKIISEQRKEIIDSDEIEENKINKNEEGK